MYGISIRNDEENEKEQAEGGGLESEAGKEISDMEVEQDVMEQLLRESADAAGVESTPEIPAGCVVAPQTSERVEIPKFAEVTTGKEFVLPDARARSRRDQVSGLTATKAAEMRKECLIREGGTGLNRPRQPVTHLRHQPNHISCTVCCYYCSSPQHPHRCYCHRHCPLALLNGSSCSVFPTDTGP